MQGREREIDTISLKTPAPHYQPIEEKKKGKIVEDKKGESN